MNTTGIGKEYRHKLAAVTTAAKGIITPKLVSKTLRVSPQEAARLLSRWNNQLWVKRIKHGTYIPVTLEDVTAEKAMEDPWILAERLFAPGYIGGFSAVKHWDFSEQLFETTTFFTTRIIKNREPLIGNTRLYLKTITPHKFFGIKTVWRDNVKVLVSDPTKTIIDLLDDPKMIGGMRVAQDIFSVYKASEYFDLELLVEYAGKIGNKTVIKRLCYLMESMGLIKLIEKYNLMNKVSKGYSLFDPGVKNTAIVRKWNLRIPVVWKISHDRKK